MTEPAAVTQAKGEISLLLEEYRALRAESTQRLGDRGTLIGFATAGAVLIVSNGEARWQFLTAAALLVIGLAIFAVRVARAFSILSRQLLALEDKLNARATTAYGTAGTLLFSWEHRWRDRPRPRWWPKRKGSKQMKTTVVRYQVKPERAEENQRLIEAVFAQLEEREPDGFTYKVFRLEDGVSFIHVVIEHDVDNPDSLQAVPAFQAFTADIAERCDVSPIATGATIVGGYR